MNPKHLETYIEGLQKTLNDKLFFVKYLPKDFFNKKIVVDFGCGDGSVLEYIHKNYKPDQIIAVDINPNMREIVRNRIPSAICFSTIQNADQFLNAYIKDSTKKKEVVVIATSVLHEIGLDMQLVFKNFCKKYSCYLIVRDMCVDVETLDENSYTVPLMAKIVASAYPKHLSEFIATYGFTKRALLHYLLKYTYVENWETEIKENYLSIKWEWLDEIKSKTIYDNKYIQEWRKNQVMKDFDIDISQYTTCTHRELIFKVGEDD